MAPDQQFCLRWNNFQTNITSQFETLRQDEDFVDVTLTCDGKRLKAHKVVLSACSPYFKDLFKNNPCKHPIIFLRDVEWCHLIALVEFMYAGVVNVAQAQLPAFLRTAESLHILGLTDAPRLHKDVKLIKDPVRRATATAMAASAASSSTPIASDTGEDEEADDQSCSPSSSPPPSKRERRSEQTDDQSNDRVCEGVGGHTSDRAETQADQMDDSSEGPTAILQQSRSGLIITPTQQQNDLEQSYNDELAEMLEPKTELPDYSSDGESRTDATSYMDQSSYGNMQDMMAGPSTQGVPDGTVAETDQAIFHELFSSRTRMSEMEAGWQPPMRRRRLTGDPASHSGPMVTLGPGVEVPASQLEAIKWSDYRKLTRGLAGLVFTPLELATCSVTGQRWSRANSYGPDAANRKVKPALDNAKVNAILYHVKSVFPEVEVSRIKQVLAYKCQESSVALKMKAGIFQGMYNRVDVRTKGEQSSSNSGNGEATL